jgi:NTP pyrophosphatase (non-canonical NTP hydrolase)
LICSYQPTFENSESEKHDILGPTWDNIQHGDSLVEARLEEYNSSCISSDEGQNFIFETENYEEMIEEVQKEVLSIPSSYTEEVLRIYRASPSHFASAEWQTQVTLGAMGLAGEAGEVANIVKKAVFHGKHLDREHLLDELGDVFWYFTLLCDGANLSLQEIIEANNQKMQARFPRR